MYTSKKFLPVRRSYKNCIFVILLLLSVYIIDNSAISTFFDSVVFTYAVKPLMWICIAIIIWRMPHIKSKMKLKHKQFINFWAFYFGFFYVLLTIFAGLLFDGFGKSPYSHSIKGIITNFIFIGSALIGREFIRGYLVNSLTKEEKYLIFILISLLLTINNFPINKYLQLNSIQSLVKFFTETFAPEFSHNLFATYLAYLGGPLTSIIYLSVIQGFHWFSPLLPALQWINTALIGILSPIFFLMFFTTIYNNLNKDRVKNHESEGVAGWVITSVLSISIIWFAVGVFPTYPSVIATGSMEPMIKPGDIILVEKIKDEEGLKSLKINDVIQFKRDNILISHRIVDIINDEKEGLKFKTKGDNNSVPDSDLVKPHDIKGTIKYTVPKIGILTLLLKSNNEIPLDKLIF